MDKAAMMNALEAFQLKASPSAHETKPSSNHLTAARSNNGLRRAYAKIVSQEPTPHQGAKQIS